MTDSISNDDDYASFCLFSVKDIKNKEIFHIFAFSRILIVGH